MFAFFLSNLLFLYCLLAYLLRSFHTCSSHKFIAIQIFYLNNIWMYEFFRNRPQKVLFRNVNLSNLKNILEKKITDRAAECIFRASGIWQILKIFPLSASHGGAFVGLMYVSICPKNSGYVTGLCINMYTTRSQTARIT